MTRNFMCKFVSLNFVRINFRTAQMCPKDKMKVWKSQHRSVDHMTVT